MNVIMEYPTRSLIRVHCIPTMSYGNLVLIHELRDSELPIINRLNDRRHT